MDQLRKKKTIIQNQSDIVYRVAEDTGLPRSTVEEVEKQFWGAVRHYLTHPLEAKSGILIQGLGKFFMRDYALSKLLKRLLIKTEGRITPKVELYQKLLKLYGKGQEK